MTNKRISKKIYFIIGVLLCAIIATVFGVLFANKDEKPSEIYVDVLPISASSDGSISSYSGVKNAKITIPATYSINENGQMIKGNDYQLKTIKKDTFKDMEFYELSIDMSNVETIESGAFENAKNIIISKMPKIKEIGDNAFNNSVALIKSYDLRNCTRLGNFAFANIKRYDRTSPKTVYAEQEVVNGEALIGFNTSDITVVGSTFYGNEDITKITIGDGIVYLNHVLDKDGNIVGCFENSNNVSSITFGNGIYYLGEKTFKNCLCVGNGFDLVLPYNVSVVPNECFAGCTALSSLSSDNTTLTMSSGSLAGCSGLQSLKINFNSTLEELFGTEQVNNMRLAGTYYVPSNLKNLTFTGEELAESALVKFSGAYALNNVVLENCKFIGKNQGDSRNNFSILNSSGNWYISTPNNYYYIDYVLVNDVIGTTTQNCYLDYDGKIFNGEDLFTVNVTTNLDSKYDVLFSYVAAGCENKKILKGTSLGTLIAPEFAGITSVRIGTDGTGGWEFLKYSNGHYFIKCNVDEGELNSGYKFTLTCVKMITNEGTPEKNIVDKFPGDEIIITKNTTLQFCFDVEEVGTYTVTYYTSVTSPSGAPTSPYTATVGRYFDYTYTLGGSGVTFNGWYVTSDSEDEAKYIQYGGTIGGSTNFGLSKGSVVENTRYKPGASGKLYFCDLVLKDNSIEIQADASSCIAYDTPVMLADGTTKMIQDVKYNDLILRFNHDTGKVEPCYPFWVHQEKSTIGYTHITFSDGSYVNIVGYHAFYNTDLNKYVLTGTDEFVVGTHVYKIVYENGEFVSKDIYVSNIEYFDEEMKYFEVLGIDFNSFANGVLVTEPESIGFQNLYGFDENLIYKDDLRKQVLNGEYQGKLYSIQDVFDLYGINERDFYGVRGAEWAILCENGYLTEEEVRYIVVSFMNNYDNKQYFITDSDGDNIWPVTTEFDVIKDGYNVDDYMFKENSEYVLPECELEGFVGWYSSLDGKIYKAGETIKVLCGTHFTAVFESDLQ